MQTKLDLYACISLILNYSTETFVLEKEKDQAVSHSDDDFLFVSTALNVVQQDILRTVVTKYGHELISLLSKDICDSPPGLRVSYSQLNLLIFHYFMNMKLVPFMEFFTKLKNYFIDHSINSFGS